MVIEGRCDFRHALVSDSLFQDIIFEQDVDFSDATFGVAIEAEQENFVGPPMPFVGPPAPFAILFRFVTFAGNAYFLRTTFAAKTSIERVNFQKEADFTEAKFNSSRQPNLRTFSFSYLRFATLRLNWDQLPGPESWVRDSEAKIQSLAELDKEKEPLLSPGRELEPLSKVFQNLEER